MNFWEFLDKHSQGLGILAVIFFVMFFFIGLPMFFSLLSHLFGH